LAGGYAGVPGRASGRDDVRRLARRSSRRACVHRAGLGRCGGPAVRDEELADPFVLSVLRLCCPEPVLSVVEGLSVTGAGAAESSDRSKLTVRPERRG